MRFLGIVLKYFVLIALIPILPVLSYLTMTAVYNSNKIGFAVVVGLLVIIVIKIINIATATAGRQPTASPYGYHSGSSYDYYSGYASDEEIKSRSIEALTKAIVGKTSTHLSTSRQERDSHNLELIAQKVAGEAASYQTYTTSSERDARNLELIARSFGKSAQMDYPHITSFDAQNAKNLELISRQLTGKSADGSDQSMNSEQRQNWEHILGKYDAMQSYGRPTSYSNKTNRMADGLARNYGLDMDSRSSPSSFSARDSIQLINDVADGKATYDAGSRRFVRKK